MYSWKEVFYGCNSNIWNPCSVGYSFYHSGKSINPEDQLMMQIFEIILTIGSLAVAMLIVFFIGVVVNEFKGRR